MKTLPSLLCLLFTLPTQAQTWVASTPAGTNYLKIDKSGTTTIPNGRFITPQGRQITTAPHPYGLAVSPDGSVAVTANSGINPISISIIRNVLQENATVRQVPDQAKTDNGVLEACFMGLAITPDNQTVYVAGGETNKIFLFNLATGQPKGTIKCATKANGINYYHGYIGDMVLTKDGSTLYAVDQIGFRLLVIDTKSQKIRHNVPTGRYPFGVCLSPDEQRVYVANVGVFEYQPFTDLDKDDLKETAHKWPATRVQFQRNEGGHPRRRRAAAGRPQRPRGVFGVELRDSKRQARRDGQDKNRDFGRANGRGFSRRGRQQPQFGGRHRPVRVRDQRQQRLRVGHRHEARYRRQHALPQPRAAPG